MAATIGVVAAGVALLESALIPGLVIGGAAMLAPKFLPKSLTNQLLKSLPTQLAKLPGRLPSLFGSTAGPRTAGRTGAKEPLAARGPTFAGFKIKQAVAKTITFRIIVTTLDFTSNYVVIGELATAAGLSAFALVVGPLFYLAHETAWNYFGSAIEREAGAWGPAVDLPVLLPLRTDGKAPPAARRGFTINRALAKTITFRTIATTMDFATN